MPRLPSPTVSFTCLTCGKEATRFVREISRISGRYCSSTCWYASRDKSRNRKCSYCGKVFANRNALKYCSPECLRKKSLERRTRRCPVCQGSFKVQRLAQKYCSTRCAAADSPAVERTPFTCLSCGKEGSFIKYTKRSCRMYCNQECQRKHMVGVNSPMYRGNRRQDRGPTWKHASAEARITDGNACVCCGAATEPKISVDHIVPYRIATFYREADPNSQINLACLCRSCHSKKTSTEPALLKGDVMGFIAESKRIIPLDRLMAALRFWRLA